MKDLTIDRLTVIGQAPHANGRGMPLGLSLLTASEQIKAATGVDVMGFARSAAGKDKAGT